MGAEFFHGQTDITIKDNRPAGLVTCHSRKTSGSDVTTDGRQLSLIAVYLQTNIDVLKDPSVPQPHDCKDETALKIFGSNVRRERVARLISQGKLAERAGLNVRTICRIESGQLNIRSETIQRLQQAIGCPLTRLIELNGRRAH